MCRRVRQAAVSYREGKLPVTFAVGRVLPWGVPGLYALDGAQVGQELLCFGYGGGEGIAQSLSVTGTPPAIGAAERIAGDEIALGTYYRWTRGRQPVPH